MADWFITNVADAPAIRWAGSHSVMFEDENDPFPELGINVRVVSPGESVGLYHSESVQEDFLVLAGECLVVIDGQERALRAWDFVHCPAGTGHVFIGAGDRPCAILMVGARRDGAACHYPMDPVAARHGASVTAATSSGREAYANWPAHFVDGHLEWPPQNP